MEGGTLLAAYVFGVVSASSSTYEADDDFNGTPINSKRTAEIYPLSVATGFVVERPTRVSPASVGRYLYVGGPSRLAKYERLTETSEDQRH